jgi:predicted phosphoribosyltransferase
VIVVDDGLATGSTMIAALRSARAEGATQLIAAVPVASVDALMQIGPLCERVVCLLQPEVFWAVGQFYADFEQVTDAQVEAALRERGRRTAQPAASGRDQATDAPTAAPWSPPAAGGRGW